ncbi:LysR family transcriptional regulator [Streptosporangium sp. CA-135522]|uniref:LysR family transcriptional regulator n=1 Tax=Streptosporangium sp. CA-135522 TaxID=3240072 RepID=UPI003D91F0E4
MELRDIEIFLTLAEELHFGRTAEQLHVSTARVSQSIKKQERRVGAALFDRTSRTVTLTAIGCRLRDDLRQGYDLIQAGLARATAAGLGASGTLRLGVMGALGNELRPVIDAFRARHLECDVRLQEFHFTDAFTLLRENAVDVQLMWLPIREPDMSVGPVTLTEGRVLAIAADHPMAVEKAASMEDLGDHPVLAPAAGPPDYWIEAMAPSRTPSGRPVPRGPAAKTFHEVLSLVASGQGVCPLNAHVARYYTHPDIVFLPILDASPTEWALVWRTGAESPLIRAFAGTARQIGPRPINDHSSDRARA